ncbi:YdcF family protein [Brevibacterium sp. VCM10]|uniref:YdcF family protein n=1 Tax=Brevibacterium sp. VCM10 TaxID=1381751 RepID=UPI001E6098B6|nr:YdcF family protein [Brevibacterium sp. VCM10]
MRTAGSDQIIVVLGYANRGQRPNGINRFRVRAGLRSIDPRARSSLLIFCGGAVAGRTSEGLILERFARDELGFTGRTVLEGQSTTTWENIANAIPIIDRELTPATTISIVSNSHHAEKARDHLWQMRPDLARRLVRGGDYRFGEHPLVKPIAAVRGLLALRALDREDAKHAAGH